MGGERKEGRKRKLGWVCKMKTKDYLKFVLKDKVAE